LTKNKPPCEVFLLENANCVEFAKRRVAQTSLYLEKGVIKAKISPGNRLPTGIPRIDIKGKYVIPGFIDCHTHLISSGIEMQRLDLSSCRSLDECLQLISVQAKTRDLVFASNWDENSWRRDEREKLNRKILDRISRKKPIIMRRICGHYAVVNMPALRHISKNWKIVDRRNGSLYEDAALNLNEIFRPTDEMLEKALSLAAKKALSLGITSVHEISNPRRFRLLQEHRHDLQIRFAVYLTLKYHPHVIASGLRSGIGDDWLKFAGTKIYTDGSLGARTAALQRSYVNTHCRGKVLVAERRLNDLVRSAEEHGIQLMIHSIGDRSSALVLRSLRRSIRPGNPLRHRIEHLEILEQPAITDIGRLKIIASMQPNFVRRWQNPGGLYNRLFGSHYLEMNCFKSLIKARAKVVFGSDCMPLGPLYGIAGTVRHPSACGKLDIADAFRLYTEAGAFATFDERKKGKLEPGYFADLVVLNKNPLLEKNLDALKIETVIVGGKFAKE
jgi:predicted amidohydrolase YtcJ